MTRSRRRKRRLSGYVGGTWNNLPQRPRIPSPTRPYSRPDGERPKPREYRDRPSDMWSCIFPGRGQNGAEDPETDKLSRLGQAFKYPRECGQMGDLREIL